MKLFKTVNPKRTKKEYVCSRLNVQFAPPVAAFFCQNHQYLLWQIDISFFKKIIVL